jgi:flagellar motility protein MotE (MotC chaperone)
MTSATPQTHAADGALRRFYGPRLGIPLLALGVAALLPARILALTEILGDDRPPVLASAAPSGAVALGEGVIATPTTAVLLSGQTRASPVGDERQPDARVLAEMSRRQAEAERRERELELREARLTAAEAVVKSQIATLSQMRGELEQLASKEGDAASSDIEALVSLYSNMRPQQAAKVFDRLEAARAATILLRIPDRQAGPILAQMDPQAALAVTQEIAGRREQFRR